MLRADSSFLGARYYVNILFIMTALESEIQFLKGVGPGLAKTLAKLDIRLIKDLLFYFPRAYDDRRKIPKVVELVVGESQMVLGQLVAVTAENKGRLSIVKGTIEQDGHYLSLVWFNQAYVLQALQKGLASSTPLPSTPLRDRGGGVGVSVFAKGKVEINRYTRTLQMSVAEFELIEDVNDALSVGRVVPVYGLTDGLYQKKIRQLTTFALEHYLPELKETFPPDALRQYALLGIKQAISNMHYPLGRVEWKQAHDRLVFEDFFKFYLRLFSMREELVKQKGLSFDLSNTLYSKYLNFLPFKLTNAQQRVISEVHSDMSGSHVMNRLVQGDVGSGKTEVAIASILTAVENGYQVAVMAPTEILAEQHYNKMSPAFAKLAIHSVLLISKLKGQDKQDRLAQISSGETQVIIGTHALIQEHVQYHNLGLVIIDEQHRFGVKQRDALKQKGVSPDLLVMTATPIPRTLALTVYGDLDKSIIDEMPPGRTPVKTSFVRNKDTELKRLFTFLGQQVEKGQQAYIVYPLVEETEKLDLKSATESAEYLQKSVFPNYRVGLLHGKMGKEDKDKVMQQFRAGLIQILVSTTVIEVGVDVANASIMVIEEVERFGLSQLHQLRGRVGRGALESYCFLVGTPKTPESKQRVKAMCQTTDGFKIAEIDLQIRGPGEFLGTRQSGLPEFKVANLLRDEKILLRAKSEVEKLTTQEREGLLNLFFPEAERQN